MAGDADIRVVVKHIVEGDLSHTLCRICLLPLSAEQESVFTTICKEDRAYSVADVLEKICNVEVAEADQFKVCKECFYAAAAAYEFYLLAARSTEILDSYTDLLEQYMFSVTLPDDFSENSLCFTLPDVEIKTKLFDYNLEGCLKPDHKFAIDYECISPLYHNGQDSTSKDSSMSMSNNIVKLEHLKPEPPSTDYEANTEDAEIQSEADTDSSEDENMVFVVMDSEDAQSYSNKYSINNFLEPRESLDHNIKETTPESVRESSRKVRKARSPLDFISCSKCPIKYRFLARLKEHMKREHNIHLYICKLCKTTSETEEQFTEHLRSHRGVHRCYRCDAVFRKPEGLTAHVEWHDSTTRLQGSNKAHICEQCGAILAGEEELREHHERKHLKKFTCHYCGRLYKCKISLDKHIEKHDKYNGDTIDRAVTANKPTAKAASAALGITCETCGKHFVDRRALHWHSMLHTNDRPFKCDVCGRGFVSLNRRNQHSLCAHTQPTRRCPLCPALFHLRSMVNTHIKKVHLSKHKRRVRASKHEHASWQTAAVPVQELSVRLQGAILEMKGGIGDPRDTREP